jgi:IPT/TIG domain-containing protein
VQVWAFDRVAMEAGQAAKSVTFNVPSSVGGVGVFSLLPSNTRTVTGLPPAGAPNYFASIYGSYNIRVWKFHVDWANTANSTFTGPTNATIGTFNVGPSSVPERQGNNLDSLSYRLMMQNQYTNIDGTESLWLTHTVGSGGSQNLAQVRWYQLAVTGGSVASAPKQQATWAPDSKNRFMPSLAVDKVGDMAVGYAVSDATMSPAIRYAGRLASDPVGVLGQGETSLVEGSGYQCCSFSSGQLNTRWGDYSAMSIDPDGCTFWYTSEYTNALPTSITGDNWLTRIGSFRFPSCDGSTQPAAPTITSFAPTSGPAGTSVTLTGTNFTGATAVSFNGVAATFAVASATSITATVPAGASTGPISVTTGGGTATTSSSFSVTVQTQAPTITSLAPASGPVGTSVTVTGTSFTGATAVSFNGTSASFSVTSPTSIVAAVPAGASTGPISVTTGGGTATTSSSFTVTASTAKAPIISSFSPVSGRIGSSVAIVGANFTGATSVKFNGVSASFNVPSSTRISALVPGGATTGRITVTTPGGTATSSGSFRVG